MSSLQGEACPTPDIHRPWPHNRWRHSFTLTRIAQSPTLRRQTLIIIGIRKVEDESRTSAAGLETMLPLGELCDAILGYLLEILIKLIGLVGCNFRVWGPWKTEALCRHTGCPPAGTAGSVYN